MEGLMRILGNKGLFIMVRFDPLREKNKFTVHISKGYPKGKELPYSYRTDTDDPYGVLVEYLKSEEYNEQ